jgi:hypothetical protein
MTPAARQVVAMPLRSPPGSVRLDEGRQDPPTSMNEPTPTPHEPDREAPPAPAATPAGETAAPTVEVGPIAKGVRLFRTVVAGTFTPWRFLARWEREGARWSAPVELLSVNGLIVAGLIYLAHVLDVGVDQDPRVMEAVARSRLARVVLEGVNSLQPVVAVWGQVLAIRIGAAVVRSPGGWPRAIRQAGFLATYYVPVSVLSIVVGALAGPRSAAFSGVVAGSVAAELAYSWIGFRQLYGVSAGRAFVGATVGLLLALVLAWTMAFLGVGAAVVVAHRFPG